MSVDRTISQDTRLGKDTTYASQNAALRGASLAFGKPPVKPKPKTNTYSGNNGALAAATKVGTGSSIQRSPSRPSKSITSPSGIKKKQRVTNHNTGSTTGGSQGGSPERVVQSRLNQLGGGDGLLQPRDASSDLSRSHSFIAATLAASRSASISPNRTGHQSSSSMDRTTRTSSGLDRRPPSTQSARSSLETLLDITPIPPTTSLIGIFEHTGAPTDTTESLPLRRSKTSASVKSPQPRTSPSQASATAPPTSPPSVTNPTPRPTPIPKPKKKAQAPTAQVSQGKQVPTEPENPKPPILNPKPSLPDPIPIPKKPGLARNRNNEEDDSSGDSFVSASDYQNSQSYQPSFRAALNDQKRHLTSNSAVSLNSCATIDSLANAIVASSLASSRHASPARSLPNSHPPAPPPTRRTGKEYRHIFHNSKEIVRTPSPLKQGLRTTMREPKPLEEIDEGEKRRGRKNLVKKHPNKHHEGDRKRWRDEITERERKRYEAVWASNKGLYTGNEAGAENTVCNLVVRDIWQRSRLHGDVLEEVYSLVDREGKARLAKEEFVVGMWLIDQRLKGRKLPIRVSGSVWKSAGTLWGIKVRKIHKP